MQITKSFIHGCRLFSRKKIFNNIFSKVFILFPFFLYILFFLHKKELNFGQYCIFKKIFLYERNFGSHYP